MKSLAHGWRGLPSWTLAARNPAPNRPVPPLPINRRPAQGPQAPR